MSAAQQVRANITMYYDIVSPWSVIAFKVLQRYHQKWDFELRFQPISLGKVMQISGNKPPITVNNKGKWMFQEIERVPAFYGVNLNKPQGFPMNTQLAQSFLRELRDRSSADHDAYAWTLMDASWISSKPVVKAEDILEAVKHVGLIPQAELEEILKKAQTKEAKDKLNEESKRLVEDQGAFGMPWFIVKRASDGKTASFFGSDRFEQIAAFMGEEYKGPFADGRRARL
ncbi:GLUTATHIONE S-TRANSFERASE KAPPA [Ceraceosorus bombacis]|uniref:Glutathione S-transferase kappa n=1 Tax=Ceraceosorus bombacis TaxID=401625 RepID=A0A0P1BG30_9BASI|nr:GLUTATHIONE S-TRANSFERASE KAPPA [Ceraceosorus bombacis]